MKQVRRTSRVLVPEHDPDFARFWAACPLKVAKLDARKAWADLKPTSELVDRMVRALAWQGPIWACQGYGTPYPATWLRAERWTDEMPVSQLVSEKTARTLVSGAAFVAGGEK
jgi:hypothetical protein